MSDLMFLVSTIVFFAMAFGYIVACEWLMSRVR